MEETPFAPRRLFLPRVNPIGRTSGVNAVVPIVCLAGITGWLAEPSRPESQRRIVIEAARLPSGEIGDVLVVDGRIEALGAVERRDQDVVVRAREGAIVAGRRRTYAAIPDWSELVGGPAAGLTSVVLPLDEAARAWLEGLRGRAAWIGPRLAKAGETEPPPQISPGFPAEILVLDPVSGALSQAVIGDEVLRRADLETRREMISNARRALASLPPPDPGLRGLRLDAAGLAVGRVDVSPDGRTVVERTVAAHRVERRWRIESDRGGWVVTLRDASGLLATIRGDATGVTAEAPSGERLRIDGDGGVPSLDLAATAAAESTALMRLPPGGELERPVVELGLGEAGLSVVPGRLSFRNLPPDRFPLPLLTGERGFRLTSDAGREALFVLGFDGFPVRGWETTGAGDVEWIGRPLGVDRPSESPGSATKPP